MLQLESECAKLFKILICDTVSAMQIRLQILPSSGKTKRFDRITVSIPYPIAVVGAAGRKLKCGGYPDTVMWVPRVCRLRFVQISSLALLLLRVGPLASWLGGELLRLLVL